MGRYGGMVNEIKALVKKLKAGRNESFWDAVREQLAKDEAVRKPKRIRPEPNEIGYT
jgi:hypothetical protein